MTLPDSFAVQCAEDGHCFFAVARRYGHGGQILERWKLKPDLLEVESPPISPQGQRERGRPEDETKQRVTFNLQGC
jgi:hypothetical protein